MRKYIPVVVRNRVREAARYRCGYCQTQEIIVSYPLHIEHIIPEAVGGSSDESNLWLACSVCNNYKGIQSHALDPELEVVVPLFNPRTQIWTDHFIWDAGGTQISGLTSIGRVTVRALKLNEPFRILARWRWASVGWHPPKD